MKFKVKGEERTLHQEDLAKKGEELANSLLCTGRCHCCTHFTDEETEAQNLLGILAKVILLVIGK